MNLSSYIFDIADFVLLILLLVVSLSVVFFKNLIINTVLMCIFSLLMALLYLVMDAPDVAITEAAVGAGVSTVFTLVGLSLIKERRTRLAEHRIISFMILLATAGALIYAVTDLPKFGDVDSPANNHVTPYYIKNTMHLIGIPNVVTAILSSFRGYDTFGETLVVLTAAFGVALLLEKEEEDG